MSAYENNVKASRDSTVSAVDYFNNQARPVSNGRPPRLKPSSGESVVNFPASHIDPPHVPETGIYPKDSVLGSMAEYVKEQSEAADCFIAGSCLTMVAACLGRNAYFMFGPRKWYPNLFTMLVGRPGDRKSDAIGLARMFIDEVLPKNRLLPGNFSKEALIDEYDKECGGDPDKLMVVSEGNILMDSWKSGYGESAGKQFLDLYDCQSLSESFKRNKANDDSSDDPQRRRVIEETSTSLLMGTTFNACRFSSEGIRSGMHRRFLFCAAENKARSIPMPPRSDPDRVEVIREALRRLVRLEGVECSLSAEAEKIWVNNHKNITGLLRKAKSDEDRSRLNSQPNQAMRVAMLFAAAKWCLEGYSVWSGEISADTLEEAIRYVDHCHASARHLDVIANREEIADQAEVLLAHLGERFAGRVRDGVLTVTKSDLYRKFINTPKRPGGMTPADLYDRIIPQLESTGNAWVESREGKKLTYGFRLDD